MLKVKVAHVHSQLWIDVPVHKLIQLRAARLEYSE